MVNSKKMSKSSIAVIVLSILLVLSLILGFTGAWFTDSAKSGDKNADIDWGTVKVQYNENTEGTGKWLSKDSAEVTTVLPGDRYALKGTIKFEGADSDMYMLVKVITPNAGALSEYVKVSALTITGLTAYTEEGLTVEDGYQFFKVSKTDAENAAGYNVAGGVTIADETPNKVGTTQLNGGADKVTLSFSIEIGVIQARNISASAAYTALKAGVPAYNAQA